MKKILINILLLGSITLNAQVLNINKDNPQNKVSVEKEIEQLKKDIEELKRKTSFLDFSIKGGAKITWGINFNDNPFAFLGGSATNNIPIHGFDFDNTLQLGLDLNNSTFLKSNSEYDFSEILFKFKLKTIKSIPYAFKPTGNEDFYEVEALDQDGEKTKIYFPKNDDEGNDLILGNFKFTLDQARLSNLLGTGFFINYADVTNVATYYGINPMTDVLKLNHDFFNHKFYGKNNLWYSFDYTDFEPEASISESVELWTSSDLGKNQSPHGFSLGLDKELTDQFNFFIEAGIASKDGFDAIDNKDNVIDYGFFIKTEPHFYTDSLSLHPKLNFAAAFQTGTKEDIGTDWASLNLSLSLPAAVFINNTDYLKIEFDLNYKIQIALHDTAFMLSLIPEMNILNNCFFLSLPIQYWFKEGKTGFPFYENIEGLSFSQNYEEHIFNAAIIAGFKSNNMFSDNFEYKLSNKAYFTTIYGFSDTAFFFHDLLQNEFYFYNVPFLGSYVTMDSFVLFTNIGFGSAHNARYQTKFQMDPKSDLLSVIPTHERLAYSNVLFGEFGFLMNFTPYMTVGFSVESPKVNLDLKDTIGNQNTYTTLKIWSEIKL